MSNSLTYYEVLGLDAPPSERKDVKRAYSRMLKQTRPEDDPEGFMRLRDAHDIALSIVARQAQDAAWEIEQSQESAKIKIDEEEPKLSTSLVYGDMLPDNIVDTPTETESDTSYAIGPVPSLDAPVQVNSKVEQEPKDPPLLQELLALLESPDQYNDRENWNLLFREARQLDIDDYVDFEYLLLDSILRFHGYFDQDLPNFDQPEKLPQKFSPSITASLFKTMNWDKVGKQGYQMTHQIDWLERRMNFRKHSFEAPTITPTNNDGNWKIYAFIIGVFTLLQLVKALGII